MNVSGSLSQALALLQSGKLDDALRHLDQLTTAQPGNADAFGWLAFPMRVPGMPSWLNEQFNGPSISIQLTPACI